MTGNLQDAVTLFFWGEIQGGALGLLLGMAFTALYLRARR